jgi:hypothetical protein
MGRRNSYIMATNSFERGVQVHTSPVSRLAASYNFLIKVILNKDVAFPFDRGSVVTSSGMLPPVVEKDKLGVSALECNDILTKRSP